jgi:hypothetical protein
MNSNTRVEYPAQAGAPHFTPRRLRHRPLWRRQASRQPQPTTSSFRLLSLSARSSMNPQHLLLCAPLKLPFARLRGVYSKS